MKAKEFFNQVADAEDQLKLLTARLDHLREIGTTITSRISGMPGGHQTASKVESAVVGMADAEAGIRAEISHYSSIVKQAQHVIDLVPVKRYQAILTYKYLCGWSLKSISDQLRYEDPHSVYRAHGYALEAAQKVLDSLTA